MMLACIILCLLPNALLKPLDALMSTHVLYFENRPQLHMMLACIILCLYVAVATGQGYILG